MRLKHLIGVALVLLAAMPATAQPQGPDHREGFLTSTTCPGTGCVLLDVAGRASIGLQVSGTWVGTLTLEGTIDGTTFQAVTMTAINGTTGVTTTTANGVWAASVAGMARVRVRASAYTSGTANVALQAAASGGGVGGGGGGGGGGTVTQGSASDASANWLVNCAVGCASATSDPDDASIAVGQTNSNSNALLMAYDGSVWRRLTFGTAGTASAQVLTVQGIASGTSINVACTNCMVGAAATATLANVASSATSVTCLASNTNRLGVELYNDSTQVLYLKFGTTASATSYTIQMSAGAYWSMSGLVYTGKIDCIWASANGNARVTELTQ